MTQITVTPLVNVHDEGFERVASAIEKLGPQDVISELQRIAKINLFISVLTLILLILPDIKARTSASVGTVARQVGASLDLKGQILEETVQFCIQNVCLASAPSGGEQTAHSQSNPTNKKG